MASLVSLNSVLGAVFGPLDPAAEFRYWVEIDGMMEGAFIECSGMRVEREILPVKEGGVNDYVHKLPGRVTHSDITLRKGVMFSTDLYEWFAKGMEDGKVTKRDITIVQYSSYFNIPARWYHIKKAYPVSWEGSSLRSDSSELSVETLTLTFETLKPEQWDALSLAAKLGGF